MPEISSFDIFKAQHKFFIGQTNEQTGKKKWAQLHGSQYGALLTIICIFGLSSYLIYSLIECFNGSFDILNSKYISNNFNGIYQSYDFEEDNSKVQG